MEEKNELLEVQKENINRKNEELKSFNKSLAELKTYTTKDSLINEINVLVNSSNASVTVGNLSDLTNDELAERINEIQQEINAYDEKRRSRVKALFSGNERTRGNARNELLKININDEQLVGDIVNELNGKNYEKNKNTYYQIIYMLGQLDGDLLKAEAGGLAAVFDEGKKANLHGSSTQAKVNQLRRKLN